MRPPQLGLRFFVILILGILVIRIISLIVERIF
jgi:hypothetical protein